MEFTLASLESTSLQLPAIPFGSPRNRDPENEFKKRWESFPHYGKQ